MPTENYITMPKAATKKGGKAEKRGKGKKGMFLSIRTRYDASVGSCALR